MLRLLDNRFLGSAADATAAYRVAILDGEGSALYSTSVVPENYSVHGRSGIWIDVQEASAEERKQEMRQLKDDSLSVRCDVTVQSLEKEARVRCFLRRLLD
ncbi:BTB/POZ and MATH domain-containing protein 2-like [Panicum miliaceum]|uniref:BTB/POZ and MATH domain-containing protein 2-like n=1 Tax=Panicum miliaceum TaxID=4540 RepID=A0A3L6Q152_PANMI|nr:BTB/POZ and MATH domain-containing protein 2-like [Panicum miliaceum]